MHRAIPIVAVLLALAASTHAQPAAIAIPDYDETEVICFALYTVHDNTLKLTAQFYPLGEDVARTATLEIQDGDTWRDVASASIIEAGWTAPFRVEDWDDTQTVAYRVNHADTAFYEGTIRRNPTDQDEVVVAAFSCNSIHPNHGGDIPRTDIVENIKRLDPDLLFFAGDQVYHHREHYKAWLRFGRDFGPIIKDYPTICIPDDHDVGHPNLWGEGGGKAEREDGVDGGYFMPPDYVNEVERAQTSHLPDPYDPTPVAQGIGVYYTNLLWGGISFAILEDRKWKTGPLGTIPEMGPRPDHVNDPNYDPKAIDVPGLVLLGERQLKFLREWGQDWTGAEMKAVLSQTIFCGGAHIHGQRDNRLIADLDSNGWPQSGRNAALREMRKAFAFHIAGDQHLATIIHHGIDTWNDAGYSFCVPAIANLYRRWWEPLEPGNNREAGAPEYTGEFRDGFGNPITVFAAANPPPEEAADNRLDTRAAGFGVVRFNKPTRQITMECWPRNADITTAQQYEGWPKTITQQDNYAREAVAYLPTIQTNVDDPVVQVIKMGSGEIVYTLRIKGREFRPKVFAMGPYTVRVQHGDTIKSVGGLAPGSEGVLNIDF